jgi:similar to spore coat protein
MKQQGLAPNETMQLHELLTLKNLSLTKSITMSPLISDNELKAIIKNDIQITQNHVKELREYLEKSMIATSKVTQ